MGRLRFRVVALTLVALSVAAYVWLRVYAIFVHRCDERFPSSSLSPFLLMRPLRAPVFLLIIVHSFTIGVLIEVFVDLACRPVSRRTSAVFWVAVGGIGLGKVVWEVEQRICADEPRVWVLHILWHCLSCVGGVFAILHNLLLRREKVGILAHGKHL